MLSCEKHHLFYVGTSELGIKHLSLTTRQILAQESLETIIELLSKRVQMQLKSPITIKNSISGFPLQVAYKLVQSSLPNSLENLFYLHQLKGAFQKGIDAEKS